MLLPAALAGCGFQPVYGPGGTGTALRGRIRVAAPDTEDDYLLVRDLETRLGRASVPEYRLSYDIETWTQGQAVTSANETTRYSITGRANFALTRIADEKVVASGAVQNFTSYSATGTTVETLASERDARRRLMAILAEQIATEILTGADLSA